MVTALGFSISLYQLSPDQKVFFCKPQATKALYQAPDVSSSPLKKQRVIEENNDIPSAAQLEQSLRTTTTLTRWERKQMNWNQFSNQVWWKQRRMETMKRDTRSRRRQWRALGGVRYNKNGLIMEYMYMKMMRTQIVKHHWNLIGNRTRHQVELLF